METYDTIIVGGGPAGLTAASHLAWHQRKVLVIDRRTGPLFFTITKLRNVPGMPEARGVDMQKKLAEQAQSLGAEIVRASVTKAEGEAGAFVVTGDEGEQWNGRTLLLATGLARYHPMVNGDFKPCFAYAGKGNLYYCTDCEAPEVIEKDTIVIGVGTADQAAGMAIGLYRYTDHLRVLFTESTDLSDRMAERLREKNIETTAGKIRELIGERGHLTGLRLEDGRQVDAEAFFVSSPARGRTDLAQQLGVEMSPDGTHAQPKSQRGDTNVPGVWIAGDLRPMTQQVSVAMGTGNIAAVMIDQWLRKQDIA